MKKICIVIFTYILYGCSLQNIFHGGIESKDAIHPKNNAYQEVFSLHGVPFGIDVSVAASLRGDKDLSHGIYLYRINCRDIFCSVDLTVINECYKNKKGMTGFSPKHFQWADFNNNLEVSRLSDTVIEITIFQAAGKKLPAKIVLGVFDEKEPPYFKRIKSFSVSGFVDLKAFPSKLSFLDQEAIIGDQLKQLDCPVFLPGI